MTVSNAPATSSDLFAARSELQTSITKLELRLYRAMLVQTGVIAAIVIGITQALTG